MLGAMDLDITDDSERADHEQAAQIAVTLFADTAQPVLAPCVYRKLKSGCSDGGARPGSGVNDSDLLNRTKNRRILVQ